MIFIEALTGPKDIETREHTEEALALAAQKAREAKRDYGLFCEGSHRPFASVDQTAWAWLYGKYF